MKKISLTMGKTAIVDDCDFEELNKYKWHAFKCRNTFYAQRGIRKNGKRTSICMHRQLLQIPDNFQIDHINGNGLDNRKENLRICTCSQNRMNSKKYKTNTTGYRGVSPGGKKFEARIQLNEKTFYLGRFSCRLMAACIYDAKAKELFGEFARLNFPDKIRGGLLPAPSQITSMPITC